eukprot:5282410-Ditylum_brightwellii.AAC.1
MDYTINSNSYRTKKKKKSQPSSISQKKILCGAQIHTANSRTNNYYSTSLWKLAGKDDQCREDMTKLHKLPAIIQACFGTLNGL